MGRLLITFFALLMSFYAYAEDNALRIIMGGDLVNAKEKTRPANVALKGNRLIGLYFSAHWCGPCRAFTPKLVQFHQKCKEKNLPFEVVFISSDKNENEMKAYMREEKMPRWPLQP